MATQEPYPWVRSSWLEAFQWWKWNIDAGTTKAGSSALTALTPGHPLGSPAGGGWPGTNEDVWMALRYIAKLKAEGMADGDYGDLA